MPCKIYVIFILKCSEILKFIWLWFQKLIFRFEGDWSSGKFLVVTDFPAFNS